MIELKIEKFENYTIVTPDNLPSDNTTDFLVQIEKILFQKHQHIVLSLKELESLFSVQLSSIIQVYKLLQEFNLKLVLCDLSFGIVNVLEMTQMTNLMPLYIERSAFEAEADSLTLDAAPPELEFVIDHQNAGSESVYSLKGFVTHGAQLQKLAKIVDDELKPVLNIAKVGFIDRNALIFLSHLTQKRKLTLRGATAFIEELLEEEKLAHLFEIENDMIDDDFDEDDLD